MIALLIRYNDVVKPARAVFLDRDGVIVEEVDYLVDPKKARLVPGSARAIVRLREAGFKAIVVSNQSAVARGMLTLRGLARVTAAIKGLLKEEGARLDAVYYCPHHPEAGRRVRCRCRKPGLALLEKAARRFKLDLKASYYVGDTTTDMLTAERAGLPGLLVATGYGGKDRAYRVRPRKRFADLAAAADWILEKSRR